MQDTGCRGAAKKLRDTASQRKKTPIRIGLHSDLTFPRQSSQGVPA
jgi:hypothetical protein